MKNKIWLLLILTIIILVFLVLANRESAVYKEKELPVSVEEETEAKLEIGIGYSLKSNPQEAVLEAYEIMIDHLEGQEPKFVILVSTVGYDQELVLKEVNLLLPGVKVYGYTSLMGIMTNSGFRLGREKNEGWVLGLAGFVSDEMVFGVGASNLAEAGSSEKAGELAILKAIENAGKSKDDLPKIILISTSPFGFGEDRVIAGVENILGNNIPFIGDGVVTDFVDLTSGGETLFANDKTYSSGVVVVPIYTNLKIGHAFLSGFNPTGDKGIATKVIRDNEIRIMEIDNKPAAQVYNEWSGGLFTEFLGTSRIFLGKAISHTLGVKIIEQDGFVNWQMLTPSNFNTDNSLTVGVMVQEGTELHLLKSDQDLFIQRPALAVRLARGREGITEKEIAGVILNQCGGTLFGITDGLIGWEEMISQFILASGEAPFLGSSNLGSYSYFSGIGNKYGQMTASVIIFGKN